MDNKRIFILLFLIVFLTNFVFAVPNAPTDLTFNRNTTSHYDEGSFDFNWTAGGGDAALNYTVYVIIAGGPLVLKEVNNSVTGFNFSSLVEANYTFIVEANAEDASATNSTGYVYMNIDTAAPAVPTELTFELNATTTYDNDGTFYLNWTAGGNLEKNYSIYISNDSGVTWFTKAVNDSVTGFLFVNTTQGNYSFKVAGIDLLGREGTNTSVLYMNIDTTAPTVTLPFYTNATKKKNTDTLTLNISVTDSGSGLTNGVCLVDVNGTNQTFAVSNGWCNSTSIALTSLTDGNKTIKVYANDSVNNLALNSSFVVEVDTTAPVLSVTCPSETVVLDSIVTCSCSGTDATSGFNESTLSFPTSFSTSTVGTKTVTCTGDDYTGNGASASATYKVDYNVGGGGGGGGGGGSIVSRWVKEIKVSDSEMNLGQVLKQLKTNYRLTFNIKGMGHHIGIKNMTSTTVTIEVASIPQIATLSIGETKKFDVDEDKYYDISVTLNSIVNNNANVSMASISELIPSEQTTPATQETPSTPDTSGTDTGVVPVKSNRKTNLWIWVIVVLLVVALGLVLYNTKKRRSSRHYLGYI